MADPIRAQVADLLERVKVLEKQMQAKNTPRQPEPKPDKRPAGRG